MLRIFQLISHELNFVNLYNGGVVSGLPQERIANGLSVPQRTLSDHLAKMPLLAIPLNTDLSNHLSKMPLLAKLINTDLSKGFTVLM